jgi:hypothetical protein
MGWRQEAITASLIIVYGTGANTGLFVYNGTPSSSNPPIFWATSASKDPFGNTIPSTAGVAGTGTFQAGNVIISPSGTVGYTAAPAANNMLYSDAPAAFTDSSGNAVLAGVTTYGKSGLTYYALNQLPGIDKSGTFGAVTTVYTGTDMTAWTAGSQLNLLGSNLAALVANTIEIFAVSGTPVIRLSHGTNLASAAAFLTATATGGLSVENESGLTGGIPAVQADGSTNAVGNTSIAGDITTAWSVPAGDGVAGTSYVIRALATLTIGQTAAETLTIGADIDAGTLVPLATLGSSFNGSTLSATYDIPLELTLDVDAVGADTPQIYLNGPLGNTSANRLATNSANMSGHSNAASWTKAGAHTLAIYAKWGGAGGSVQTIQTIKSKFYREGP